MHLLDQPILGAAIVLLLGALVVIKQLATRRILDKPVGSLLVQSVNSFNLFFLLVVNPLAAVLLITGRMEGLDPTHVVIEIPLLLVGLEIVGLVVYVMGYLLMGWALTTLGRNYQLGGSAPRAEDRLVVDGPYRLIRHPMYTAALGIALGLACLVQSWAFLCVFLIYLALLVPLIPMEDDSLRLSYGERYSAYERRTRRLIPFAY